MTLDEAQDAFRSAPNAGTAKAYANELFQYHADEMIGNDTLRNGLIEIADDLTGATNDLGALVETITRAL